MAAETDKQSNFSNIHQIKQKKEFPKMGSIAQSLAYLFLDTDGPGLIPSIPKKFRVKNG